MATFTISVLEFQNRRWVDLAEIVSYLLDIASMSTGEQKETCLLLAAKLKKLKIEPHVPLDDMHNAEMCDDCFEKSMEQESRDFDIYYEQGQKCFRCGLPLSGWVVRDNHAVCWPSCDNRLPPPIQIGA